MTATRDSLIIFFVGLILFVVGLPDEFIGFQCRFGLFAKEMLWNGLTFFPTVYGQPYPDYPATSTILVYPMARLFGEVTPFMTILPSAIASALILVFIYRTGLLRSRKWGLYAVLMAMLTYEFAFASRTVSLDQYTSLATIVCFYLVYSSYILGRTRRLWLIPLMLIAGFAFRGPIGLLVPAAVTCAFYLWPFNLKRFAIFAVGSLMLMGLCIAAYLAMAYSQGGNELVHSIIGSQAVDRMNDRPVAWYFYWVHGLASYALAYPLALLVAIAILRRRPNTDPNYRLLRYLAVWSLVVMVGLSIPAAKKIRYILPVVPAFSLMAAYIFASEDLSPLLRKVKDALISFFLWLPAGLFVATIILFFFGHRFDLTVHTSMLVPAVILLAIAAAPAVIGSRPALSHWGDATPTIVAVLAFLVFSVGIIEPLTSARESSAAFVCKLEDVRANKPGHLVFFRLGPDGEDVKYASFLDYPVVPSFTRSFDDVTGAEAADYIVTSQKEFAAMPQEVSVNCDIVARGRIGHKDCVAFRIPGQ